MGSLGAAPPPPVGRDDHVRGPYGGPLVIEYSDFECPFCALCDRRLNELCLRRVFRHFPVQSKHPRAWPAACAAEAAACQGRFWPMHDALFADQGRLDDPHLWRRAQELGLDLERFETDRRSESVATRVRGDFRAAVRAGVVTTPTLLIEGVLHVGVPDPGLLAELASRRSSQGDRCSRSDG